MIFTARPRSNMSQMWQNILVPGTILFWGYIIIKRFLWIRKGQELILHPDALGTRYIYPPPYFFTFDNVFIVLMVCIVIYIVVFSSPRRYNRVIQSIEIENDMIKFKTFSYKRMIPPMNLKSKEFNIHKNDLVIEKPNFVERNFGSRSCITVKYNGKRYFIITRLFDDIQKVADTINSLY